MADLTRLETALRNADAAGDVDAARTLAGEIMRLRAAPQEPNTAIDMAKSAGTGIAEGAISTAGAGGDVRDLLSRGADWAGGQLGLSPETIGSVKDIAGVAARSNPLTAAIALGPTSQQVGEAVKERTGEFYEPQTTGGEYARTVGQFLPAAMFGPGGVMRRVGMQAVLPGVASEAAGQATEGTAAEPYARAGAALTAGVMGAQRAAPQGVMAADLQAAARGAYKSPEVQTLVIDPAAASRVANQATQAMERGGARRSFAGPAFDVTDELRSLPNTQAAAAMRAGGLNPGATVDDIKSVRTALREVVKSGTDNLTGGLNPTANAAVTSRKTISDYLSNIPAKDVIRGDAAAAGATLKRADADYAASKRAGLVEALTRRAELQAGSANSGQNINNATRQKLRSLAASAKQSAGLNDAERKQLDRAVLGTRIGNAARTIGNTLGGSGVLSYAPGAVIGGGSAMMGADPSTAVALALLSRGVGKGARAIGDRSTARQNAKFQDMVSQRAPSYESIKAVKSGQAARLTAEERKIALIRALLSSQAAPRLNAPQPVNQ